VERKKSYESSKKLLTSIKERGHMGRKAPLLEKKGRSVRIRRVASRQVSRPLLISLKVRRMFERMSGLHKLMGLVHRLGMKL